MWCGVVWCVVWYGVVWCEDAVWCGVVRCSVMLGQIFMIYVIVNTSCLFVVYVSPTARFCYL